MYIEEYYDILAIALCKAARTFNPEKSTFSHYAFRCFTSALNNVWKKEMTYKANMDIIYLTDDQNDFWKLNANSLEDISSSNAYQSVELNELVNKFRTLLNPRHKMVFDLLLQGMKITEVSQILQKEFGFHPRSVYESHNMIKNKWVRFIKNMEVSFCESA